MTLLLTLVLCLVSLAPCSAAAGAAADEVGGLAAGVDETAPGGWIRLGPGLDAWRDPAGRPAGGEDADDWFAAGAVGLDPADPARLTAEPGQGVLVNGVSGRTRHLFSRAELGDVEAHIELMVPRGSNSGVYFMGRYEIQVLDSFGKDPPNFDDCGGIYQRWDPARGPGNEGYEGRPPRVNASREPGRWQSFDVIFRAPRFDDAGKKVADACFFRVVHNGIVVHENEKVTGPTRAAAFDDEAAAGPLMLQGDHGPLAYANIWVRPIHENDGDFFALTVLPGLAETAAAIWSPNPQVSRGACLTLGCFDLRHSLPYRAGALRHPDADVRFWSLTALDDGSNFRPLVLAADVDGLLRDANASVRMAAARFLRGTEHVDAALAVLIREVESGAEGYADTAADSLSLFGPSAAPAVPALEKLAASPNGKLRLEAKKALAAIQP